MWSALKDITPVVLYDLNHRSGLVASNVSFIDTYIENTSFCYELLEPFGWDSRCAQWYCFCASFQFWCRRKSVVLPWFESYHDSKALRDSPTLDSKTDITIIVELLLQSRKFRITEL